MKFVVVLMMFSLGFARELLTYDYETIRQVSRIAAVAYQDEDKPKYQAQLEAVGWTISDMIMTDFGTYSDFPVGVIGRRENLVVIAYAGTQRKIVKTLLADANFQKANIDVLSDVFSEKGYIHEGILEYYLSFGCKRLPSLMSEISVDASIILTGHSLGGALAEISLMDYYAACFKKNLTPEFSRMSLLTMGAPAILSSNMRTCFDSWFPNKSYLRLYCDGDPVSHIFGMSDDSRFCHAGFGLQLPTSDHIAHRIIHYIRKIDQRNGWLAQLWPFDSIVNYKQLAFKRAFERVRSEYTWNTIELIVRDQLKRGDPMGALDMFGGNQRIISHLSNWYHQTGEYYAPGAESLLLTLIDVNSMIDQEEAVLIAQDQEKAKFYVPFEEGLEGDLEIVKKKAEAIVSVFSKIGQFGL